MLNRWGKWQQIDENGEGESMVELDQFKYTLSTYDETLKEVKDSLDLENKERRITELDKSMEEPGFWDDPER